MPHAYAYGKRTNTLVHALLARSRFQKGVNAVCVTVDGDCCIVLYARAPNITTVHMCTRRANAHCGRAEAHTQTHARIHSTR